MSNTDPEKWKLDVNDRYQKAVATVISLSSAALISPIVFLKDIATSGEHGAIIDVLNCYVYVGWLLLGASIIAGILYYYLSAKWVKLAWSQGADVFWIPLDAKWTERFLDWTYFLMMSGFIVGTVLMLMFMATYVKPK
jgi:hypothetical protein